MVHRRIGGALHGSHRDRPRRMQRNPVIHLAPQCDRSGEGDDPPLSGHEAEGVTLRRRDADVFHGHSVPPEPQLEYAQRLEQPVSPRPELIRCLPERPFGVGNSSGQ